MRANRRVDTKPELALRRALHGAGYRYRKDYRLDLGGTRVRPDIAFTARRVAVFVDGCFWHVCPEHGTQPAANTWYWEPKLARNVERDRAADAALTAAGWQVVRIWEHVSVEAAIAAVTEALARSGGAAAPAVADVPPARTAADAPSATDRPPVTDGEPATDGKPVTDGPPVRVADTSGKIA
ncbi:MAG TPA: hypothetical protein DEH11_10400 [Actinobacteria bacterium]|nr:hypothetical protein [Actinomycetota bacterium]